MKSVQILDRVGDIHITCSTATADSVELHVDSDHNVGVLRVRLYGADDEVRVERLVRAVPSTIRFRLPEKGSYAIEVAPAAKAGQSRVKNLTWSDWAEMMGQAGGSRGGSMGTRTDVASAQATLRVA